MSWVFCELRSYGFVCVLIFGDVPVIRTRSDRSGKTRWRRERHGRFGTSNPSPVILIVSHQCSCLYSHLQLFISIRPARISSHPSETLDELLGKQFNAVPATEDTYEFLGPIVPSPKA